VNRTRGAWIRNPLLYPLSYGGDFGWILNSNYLICSAL
jgi:hypothetical protein